MTARERIESRITLLECENQDYLRKIKEYCLDVQSIELYSRYIRENQKAITELKWAMEILEIDNKH